MEEVNEIMKKLEVLINMLQFTKENINKSTYRSKKKKKKKKDIEETHLIIVETIRRDQ